MGTEGVEREREVGAEREGVKEGRERERERDRAREQPITMIILCSQQH